nr:olfactory receptor 97 [Microplitis mediator]
MFNRDKKSDYLTTTSCEELWNLDITILNTVGVSLRDAFGGEYRKSNLLETTLYIVGLIVHSLFIYFALHTLYVVKNIDLDFITDFIPVVFGMSMTIMKGSTLWFHRRELFEILKEFHTRWIYTKTKVHLQNKIHMLINTSKRVRYCYMTSIIVIGLSFGLRPYLLLFTYYFKTLVLQSNSTIDFSVVIYPLAYPFTYQTMNRYVLLLLYEQCVNYFAICYVTCDTIFIQLMTHTSINFLVLADDFRNMDQHIDINNDDSDNDNDGVQHMIELVNKHRSMLSICEKIESSYSRVVFFTMVLNGLDLCLCILSLDKQLSEGNWESVTKNVVHAFALFVQIIIYCNFSNTATEMTARIQTSIYDSEWTNCSIKFRKMIMLMMTYTSKKYTFSAYGIITLDREQMTKIFQTTMSYFTLLRSFT